MDYEFFIFNKTHSTGDYGFAPSWMPDILFPFQVSLVEWACRKGRAAVFADCGLGKTFMQLAWAENVCRKTGGRVLIMAPLAVSAQTVREGEKIGVDVMHRREGLMLGDRVVVTNYERLHYFDRNDFAGVVCDESSILKNSKGETRKAVTDFMRKVEYRLLCTATASPNDYVELGTSSEALGDLGQHDMLTRFFKQDNDKSAILKRFRGSADGRVNVGGLGKYRMKPHAETDFWRWVCSWARAMRRPSDIGFDDCGFHLPPLDVRQHVVVASRPRNGLLFDVPAVGLSEQREDLRNTLNERCEMAASLINAHDRPAIAWCNLNTESSLLAKQIAGAIEVSGNDSEEFKEAALLSFMSGDSRVLVTKPTIGGFGLNFQHCAHQTYFPSHSYEQYYQSVRRSWRFGQKNEVVVDVITTEGQNNVLANLKRKSDQADAMFDRMVALMWKELKIERVSEYTKTEGVPSWL